MIEFRKALMCAGVLATLLTPLAACNTVEGIGEDTEVLGDTIQEGAQDNKGY
jgi:predicted small secreted protein